ncbi:MAG: hypothetical protein LBP59_06435 [Planctomycetaceae bacterium]|jgi:hypothetical protein|nr:hypothetical protein [Planctomycetaceae bacterium]
MPNDVKQPVAFSFQDYRDEAIIDFFANEHRSYQPDVSGGISGGRLRIVGSSCLESRPTAAFRTSISLAEASKTNSGAVKILNSKKQKSSSSTSTSSATLSPSSKLSSQTPKQPLQSKPASQLKTSSVIGAVSLICDSEVGLVASASGVVSERIEAALSKPVRSIASLSKTNKSAVKVSYKTSDKTSESSGNEVAIEVENKVDGEVTGKVDGKVESKSGVVFLRGKFGGGVNGNNLELPPVVTPELQPVLPLRDRISVLRKRVVDGADALRLVKSQVTGMQNEIESAINNSNDNNEVENNNNNGDGDNDKGCVDNDGVDVCGGGLRIVSGELSGVSSLRVIDVDGQLDEVEQNVNLNNNENIYYDNVRSSIKFDQNLQKLVKAWSWLPEQIKTKILAEIQIAEKENKG